MSYGLLLLVVVFAAYGAVSLGVSAAAAAAWPAARWTAPRFEAAARARLFFLLRVAPTALALLAATSVALPSFLEFEPPDADEVPGPALLTLAAVGASFAVLAAVRLLRASSRTRRLVAAWTRDGRPAEIEGLGMPAFRIPGPAPVVALAGWLRPRLFIADPVLGAADRWSLAAMAAHELSHRGAADNAKRLAIAACADPLLLTGLGDRIAAAWEEASEDAADDAAIARGAHPADLAAALLLVARLAPARSPRARLAASFLSRGDVERRVRRLLATSYPRPGAVERPRSRRLAAALALLCAWVACAELLHRPAFRLVEHGIAHARHPLRALVVDRPHA